MKAGRDANRSGWYFSECCLKEVALLKGQMCPRCPTCRELTVWVFVGKGELRVRTRREDDSVVVEITENGPGISPEIQPSHL